MGYVPHNMQVYLSAWTGALSGMGGFTRGQTSKIATSYDSVVQNAATFAEELDTIYQPTSPNELDLELIEVMSQGLYAGRFQQAETPSGFTDMAQVIKAIILSSEAYASGNLPPIPIPVPPGPYLPLSGGTMAGSIDMGTHKISHLDSPTTDDEAANRGFVNGVGAACNAHADAAAATAVITAKAYTDGVGSACNAHADSVAAAAQAAAISTSETYANGVGTACNAHADSVAAAAQAAAISTSETYADSVGTACNTHANSVAAAAQAAAISTSETYCDTAPATNGQVRISNASTWLTFGAIQGPNLTNADQTIAISDGTLFYLLTTTLTANRTKTLGTTGSPLTGETIAIARFDISAYQLIVSNGLSTIFTFPGDGVQRIAYFTYQGSRYAFANTARIIRAT